MTSCLKPHSLTTALSNVALLSLRHLNQLPEAAKAHSVALMFDDTEPFRAWNDAIGAFLHDAELRTDLAHSTEQERETHF